MLSLASLFIFFLIQGKLVNVKDQIDLGLPFNRNTNFGLLTDLSFEQYPTYDAYPVYPAYDGAWQYPLTSTEVIHVHQFCVHSLFQGAGYIVSIHPSSDDPNANPS